MINFDYTRVTTVKAAVDAFAKNPGSGFIAGGTNLVDLMKKGVTSPGRLIDINGLPLKDIEENTTGVNIGALVLNSELAGHETIRNNYPLISLALLAGASAQLRNMATVGGNLLQRTRCPYFYDTVMPCNKRQPGTGCGALKGYNRMHAIFGASEQCIAVHPSDFCVGLAAMDAVVTVAGPKGERKISFADFHRLPGTAPDKDNTLQKGELVTNVFIPKSAFGKNVYYLKIRDRASYAFALVSVAAALELNGNTIRKARIALGGVAHKPWRLTASEKFLEGKTATLADFEQAAKIGMQGAKSYGENDFKRELAPAAITDALTRAAAGIS